MAGSNINRLDGHRTSFILLGKAAFWHSAFERKTPPPNVAEPLD